MPLQVATEHMLLLKGDVTLNTTNLCTPTPFQDQPRLIDPVKIASFLQDDITHLQHLQRRNLVLDVTNTTAIPTGCKAYQTAWEEDDYAGDVAGTLSLHCSNSSLNAVPSPLPASTVSL